MNTLTGRNVIITVAEPFEFGRVGKQITGQISGQVQSSTGELLAVMSGVNTFLISPRYSGESLDALSTGSLTVHIAKTDKKLRSVDTIHDKDIETIGSGVARLVD